MRTHCKRGHDLAKVGTYRGQKCIQCSKDSYYERRDRNRNERLRAKQAAGASLKQSNQPERAGFTEAALLLFRRAEDAMPWERDAMKARARAMAHGEPQPAGGER